jgi:hypothetical protein
MRFGLQPRVTSGTPPGRLVVACFVALALGLALAAPLRAQDASSVPAPIIAPVLATTGVPELAIRSVYVDPASAPAEPTVVVQFAGSFTLPPDGYRLSVFFGDPEGVAVRASLRTVGGQLAGSLETDESGAFVEIGPLSVTTTEDGTARLTVPADAIPDAGSVWVVAEVADPVGSTVSPLFPIEQFFDEGTPGTLSASTWAWLTPPGGGLPTVVDLPSPPALTVEGDIVRLTYTDISPAQIAGQGRTSFVDAVRIAPDFATAGQAPYLIAVDHVGGAVNLLDGTQPLPATLDGPTDPWLVRPFPLGGVDEGTVIEFDLSEVAEAFGITLSPETTTLGAARSVVLDDGTVVRADGVQATLDWFGASVVPADAEAGETEASGAEDAADASDDEFPWLLVVAGTAALALVVGLGVWWVLGNMRSHADHPAGLLDLAVRHRSSGDDTPLALGRREPLPSRVGGDGSSDETADEGDPASETIELREPTPASAPHDGADRAGGANAESGASLAGLFTHGSEGESAIDVPDLSLFDDSSTPAAERPAPPRKRPAQSDELTRALFDHD